MKSARVTLVQTRRAWRLLGDARDLRHRPTDQAVAMVDGLCKLFGGDNGFHMHMADYRPGGQMSLRTLQYGTVKDVLLQRWFEGRLGTAQSLFDDIMVVHSIARRARTTVLTHDTLWPRLKPEEFPIYAQVLPAYQMRDNLVMMFRPNHGRDMWAYAVHRRNSYQPFSPAQRQLAAILMSEMRRLHEANRLTPVPEIATDLPPRSAQVFRKLCHGESPKQIAAAMRLSVYTVRDHIKIVYDHYRVNSIQELLVRVLSPD